MAAGADDYLVKPFSGNELLARVETALWQLRRVRNEARAQFETLLNEAPLGVLPGRRRFPDYAGQSDRDDAGLR